MLTSPWGDVITRLEERIGNRLMKLGPAGNGMGGRVFIDRRSYILTSGSGTDRDCLGSVGDWVLGSEDPCVPQSQTNSIDIVATGL